MIIKKYNVCRHNSNIFWLYAYNEKQQIKLDRKSKYWWNVYNGLVWFIFGIRLSTLGIYKCVQWKWSLTKSVQAIGTSLKGLKRLEAFVVDIRGSKNILVT